MGWNGAMAAIGLQDGLTGDADGVIADLRHDAMSWRLLDHPQFVAVATNSTPCPTHRTSFVYL